MVRRTVDLLPEIFRTDTNRKFLGATLDQLTQEPVLTRTQGFVGRRVGPSVNPQDGYIVTSPGPRTDYQLEPGVVFLEPDTTRVVDAITYPGILDALELQGADVSRHDRLMNSKYYTWDSFSDLDKFVNYGQYYWLKNGPDPVDVFGTDVPLSNEFDVTRTNAYTFSNIAERNPVITLVRGGNYQFRVDQPGSAFWIQAAPGIAGTLPDKSNISSRTVLGVTNNGTDSGVVNINVPTKTAQDFFFELPSIGTVDLITELRFNQVNNVYVDEFFKQNPRGIDNITNLNGRTVVFINRATDAVSGGWQITSFFDDGDFDPLYISEPERIEDDMREPPGKRYWSRSKSTDALGGQPGSFDQTTDITDIGQRYSIWQINYITDDAGRAFMRLQRVAPVPELSKFTVKFGTRFSSTEWYKTSSGVFERIPLLTAVLDTLWYQDGNNPEIFGRILLVEPGDDRILDINEIVGATQYTSPNGVRFTNGLKVKFLAPVSPAAFQGQEYYVEGVGTGSGIANRVGFVDGEAYFGPWHEFGKQRLTGAAHQENGFQQIIYDTVEESLANIGAGLPGGASAFDTSLPGAINGTGIKLIPVSELILPGTDVSTRPDYIVVNRASQNRNAWSRGNRWFHIDVVRETAKYNNQPLLVDNDLRARRPIIEFRPNLELFNHGRQAKPAVNVVDFSTVDAFSFVAGQASYAIDNYRFVNGSRVVFAADTDSDVRNQIWQVEFIDPDGSGNEVINLTPIANGTVLPGQNVLSLNGRRQQGKTFWFDGAQWRQSQDKTRANQPPLFDVRDANNNSFSNNIIYPSTSFKGSKLFGYATGTGTRADDVLGFPLKYQNINNVGDIVFENYLYTDNFLFVRNSVGETKSVSDGFVREYINRTDFSNSIGWQTAISTNTSRQIFNLPYANVLTLDVAVDDTTTVSPLQIFANGKFVPPVSYIFETTDRSTVITFIDSFEQDAQIEVRAISQQSSPTAYYQVPLNLESNPLNQNSNTFTLGTIRTHYETIGQNLRSIAGSIVGANNTRDLGNVAQYGQLIVQNSSPLILTGAVLRNQAFEFFKALQFNNLEYNRYKSLLLTRATEGEYTNLSPTDTLDEIVSELSLGRSEVSPFYWSDMLPSGRSFVENSYTYGFTSTPTFDTIQTYDFTRSNFSGLLIYLNGQVLLRGKDYVVSADSPTVEITAALKSGDRITIREYSATYGSFVPNTPTKLGLYPAYQPEIYEDNTYITPRTVIRGHDGSVTVAFGDFRDQVLLEFETRIYNNLKVSSRIPLSTADVIPGQFRTTDYSLTEINDILTTDFLTWVGQNKLDYTTQTFVNGDPFTYNYSRSGNRLSGETLLGAWRGIYRYFYDTDHPDTRPWEMLGLSEKPAWWERQYGPAPYTSGNRVLWDDLAAGIIRDPARTRTDARYARPELLSVLPVDSEGNLLPPLSATVGNYDGTSFRRSWRAGDVGPAEHAWRTSSAWPFAAMRLLAVTRPAEFFSLFADRDRYRVDSTTEQYLWDGRYRLDANNLRPLYGNGVSTASYFNWIIDYNSQLGINSTDRLTDVLDNIDVRLCWRTRAFTDKTYLKIFTERSSPDNISAAEILPDESYRLLLYKNQPFERVTYSSVIVQQTSNGWAVLGYDQQRPFFTMLESRPAAGTQIIASNELQVRIAVDFTDQQRQVPYGFVFATREAVCDFLVGYGEWLAQQGLIFESRENGLILDWSQMCQEFLAWSQQGWGVGSIINLNPGATSIAIERADAIVDNLNDDGPESVILNQNRQALTVQDLVIDRLDNLFKITSVADNTINFVSVKFTAYEHMLVLDNRSIFADVIYEPVTGARQSRLKVAGWLTGNWTGTPNAPGFVINQDTVQAWAPNRRYAKGDIVEFKGEFWTASAAIAPNETFDSTLWLTSNYNPSRKGLLPNAAAQSVELTQAFSSNSVNLEQEVDLFSYGLIGFRPREYMQNLNLDDASQVNVYREFLNSKGTLPSAELFGSVDLGKEQANYNITEYWAALRSQYGATANRNYVEFLLDRAKLASDPSIVELIDSQQVSGADQTVPLSSVWKSSVKLQSTQVFPSKLNRSPKEINLPNAGFVNLDDVDIAEFDLDQLASADQLTRTIRQGSTIWIARIDKQNWGVFTAKVIPGNIVSVSDNLNGRARVIFNQEHSLAVGDILVIKFFNPVINGIYRVRAVTDSTSVLIDFDFSRSQTEINGVGVGLTLSSIRVAQPADIVDISIAAPLEPGVKIWVDNNGNNQWQLLEKSDPFAFARQKTPADPVAGSKFGATVAQGLSNLSALVGAPEYSPVSESRGDGSTTDFSYRDLLRIPIASLLVTVDGVVQTDSVDYQIDLAEREVKFFTAPANNSKIVISEAIAPGAVYTYLKTPNNTYERNSTLTLDVVDAAGYGNAMDIGRQDWAVVGASRSNNNRGYAVAIFRAPGSNVFEQQQLLLVDPAESVTSSDEFGFSVTLSQDERWMYVGAPGGNRVYAYSRIDVPQQTVVYTANGFSSTFNYADEIVIDNKSQLVVSVAGRTLGSEVGYLVDVANGNIVFAIPPAPGATVRISRRSSYINQLPVPLDDVGDGSNREFSFANNFAIVDPTQLLVLVDGDVRTAGNSSDQYQVDIDNSLVIFNTPPAIGAEITITLVNPTIGEADSKTTVDLTSLFSATSNESITVSVNGVIQRPGIDYTVDSNRLLTFDILYDPGTLIVIRARSYWKKINELALPNAVGTEKFGHRVTTTTDGRKLIISAPGVEIDAHWAAGKVYVYDRLVQNFQVVDPEQRTYTAVETINEPANVFVNGKQLIKVIGGIDNQYNIAGNTVTIDDTVELSIGDVITVDINQFVLEQEFKSGNVGDNHQFGFVVDQCVDDCSLYVSSPFARGKSTVESGQVEFFTNQARVYGIIEGTEVDPKLKKQTGNRIRINNFYVDLSSPPTWSSASSWPAGQFVIDPITSEDWEESNEYTEGTIVNNDGKLYEAVKNVPAFTEINVEEYWQQIYEKVYQSIRAVPSGEAIVTTDELGETWSLTKFYSMDSIVRDNGNLYKAIKNVPLRTKITDTEYWQPIYWKKSSWVELFAEDINNSQIPNVFARVANSRLVIQAKNIAATRRLSRLQVAPGTGTLFDDLGFAVYVPQQTIVAPVQQDRAFFGKSLFISDDTVSLLVGAPNATAIKRTTFDNGQTIFDANSTVFTLRVPNSGVVYSYDYLPAVDESVENFGQYVFGQQILSQTPTTSTKFGSSVDYTTGTLLIGAPDCSVGPVTAPVTAGCVASYRNTTQGPAWKTTRLQQPVVDVDRLNTTFLYNRQDNIPAVYLDYFDPLQGRLLGAVSENINYIGAVDPAAYNIGSLNNFGRAWQAEHVGEIWWNTSRVRFIDPNQDDSVYASRRWGQLFPGSRVEVYQWTASNVPPGQYPGPGTPVSVDNFVVSSRLNDRGVFVDEFYFWVTGINTVNTAARKTLSINTIARYIENPRASGIPYVAIINPSTVAIYNSLDNITSQDTVLHIEYDRLINDSAVHTEYQLIAEDRADGFLTDDLYRKLQDSLCGVNENGAIVPDPRLNVGEKYGIAARPRQGMFVDRFTALENYLRQVNRVLKQEPVTESRRFNLLNSAEPEPASFSGAWDKRVMDIEELTFQNLRLVPLGYRYLVASDLNFQGRWTIYQVDEGATTGSRELGLVRVQTFDTRLYWKFVDWFRVDYNPTARITVEVPVFSSLETLTVPVGSSVRVLSNSQGKWEIYQLNSTGWQRVGLQDGTIEISDTLWNYQSGRYGFDIEVFDAQFYDQEPTAETRKIIQAINQDLLTDNLAIERNRLLILIFNYILSEQRAPEWLTKTSLIDVDHTVRQLLPFPSFRRDNQEFVIDYINEVKPYHTQIREFNLIYQGQELYDSSVTDFDLPAFWDEEQRRFVSPVLDDLGILSTTSSTLNDSETWNTFPWNQWYQNRFLEIDSVKIVDGGIGYTVPPQVTVTGDCVEPARLMARVDSQGRVSEIEVVSPGCDYVTTPIITITGGNGTGARAAAVTVNRLVRNIKTVIKYDRYEYQTSVVPWQAGLSYAADSLVRFADRVWRAKQLIQSIEFDPDQWTEVPANDLSGVDRTMGYYVPTVNQPGLDLALLMSGIDYPGVQVKGVSFDFEPGFDSGAVENINFILETSQDPLYINGIRNVGWSDQAPQRVGSPNRIFTPEEWVSDRFTGGLGFDVAPFDNVNFGPEGLPTYDPDILDVIYQSQYTDSYLGTLPAPSYNGNPPTEGPNPIVVDGGEFVDTYSSYAPEELVPGAIFDTLDMRVFTTPGADWSGNGHGFPSATRKFVYHSSNSNQFDFGDLLLNPSVIQVWNQTRRALLTQGRDYTVSWHNKTVTVVLGLGATNGEVVVVTAYELGGGNQLFVNSYTGDAVSSALTIPVEFNRIDSVAVFANGTFVPGVDATELPGKQTLLAIPGSYGPADYLTVTVLGVTAAPVYSWSAPLVENFVATGSNTFVLNNSLSGTNPANIIVTKNGIRARPASSATYISDGTTIDYPLPVPFDSYDQSAINDPDVSVYLDSVKLILGIDYTITPFDVSSDRVVLLNQVPADGSTVLVSVDTDAQYTITDNVLTWRSGGAAPLATDDRISVTTWNDTQEQDLLTLVYQGPRTAFRPVFEPFDPLTRTVPPATKPEDPKDPLDGTLGSFDVGSITGQSGSFDFSGSAPVAVNRFELGRTVARPDRLAVTLNGSFLFENVDYTVEGTELVILGPTIGPLQVVAITLVTDNTVPPAVAFRLFHDMRGQQATYRITDATTVRLTQPVALDDDVIHVDCAARLSAPNLELGIFGFVTINGERISYWSRDTENNTISGLRRGTAGTGVAAHAEGTPVYDIGVVNLLPSEHQIQAKRRDFVADGSTSQFVAENINIGLVDIDSAVKVRIGGILQDPTTYIVDSVNPVSVTLNQVPPAGVEVAVLIQQSLSWYNPGATTPGNGAPLQDQNTSAARFIRGI